jgi:hypothetical protein
MDVDLHCERGDDEGAVYNSMEVGANLDMGLGAGGRMKQQIFKDPFGIEDWSKTHKTRVFIHMANSLGWKHVTGQEPPTVPISASVYTQHNYPWFHMYSEGAKSLQGTEATKGLKSLAELAKEKKLPLLPENQPAQVKKKQTVVLKSKSEVKSGSWAR